MRVRQNANFLCDYVRDAAAGKLVPAAFQRPYVWTRDDVEALWRSLLNGWPIGSLLLWEPQPGLDLARAGRLRLGPFCSEGGKWTQMILDGQNRLASMAWSLKSDTHIWPQSQDLSPAERKTWDTSLALVCDWDTRSVIFVPKEEADEGYRIPAGTLADTTLFSHALFKIYNSGRTAEAPIDWLDKVANTVRDARIAVTLLENATAEEAVEAYRHIARVGQPVTAADIEHALSWLDRSTLDADEAPARSPLR